MAEIQYEEWNPGHAAREALGHANAICEEYRGQGYDLTLRQLYYQFVARGMIENSLKSYKRLGDIVNRGRLAGMLDWAYIVDRTRNLKGTSHWDSPSQIIDGVAYSYRIDKWERQPRRVEVWVEKEALAGVIAKTARRHDVDYFACRGYVSQSELWRASMRLKRYSDAGQAVTVLHLGDHDPSGIDMTRDIEDRKDLFTYVDTNIEIRRIALNMDQVKQYNPPPNPAKLTDSRAMGYIEEFGASSWELDALDPKVLDALISKHINELRDDTIWAEDVATEERHRALLKETSDDWSGVVEYLEGRE